MAAVCLGPVTQTGAQTFGQVVILDAPAPGPELPLVQVMLPGLDVGTHGAEPEEDQETDQRVDQHAGAGSELDRQEDLRSHPVTSLHST